MFSCDILCSKPKYATKQPSKITSQCKRVATLRCEVQSALEYASYNLQDNFNFQHSKALSRSNWLIFDKVINA